MSVVDLSEVGLTGQQAFYDRMNTAAQTRSLDASADKQNLENQQTEAMMKLNELAAGKLQSVLNGDKRNGIDPEALAERMNSLADPMEAAAKVYATSGAGVDTAMELFKQAAEVRKKEQEIDSAAITDQQNRLENVQKGFQLFRSTMGVANNDAEWAHGQQEIISAIKSGAISSDDATVKLILSQPFSPEFRDYLNVKTLTAEQELAAEFREKQEARLRQKALADTAQAQVRIDLQRARDAQQARYQDHLMKVAGKGGGPATPNGAEVEQARDALSNTVFKGVNIKTADGKERLRAFDDAANYVASLAKTIVKENQALSWDQAVQQAIVRGQDAGVFTVDGATPADEGWLFGLGSKPAAPGKAKFERTGKTPDAALAMPASRSAMKKGTYYMTAQGVAKWNGSAFEAD